MKKFFFVMCWVISAYCMIATTHAHELLDTQWDLVSYDGTGASGTLEITADSMVSKFCNTVSQGYVYSSGSIIASGMGMSTMMYCDGLPMLLENNFDFTKAATVSLSGNQLHITTYNKHLFVFEQHSPIICTMQYEPVCGSDGKTYGNSCSAAAAKVSVVSNGICPSDEHCIQKFDGCNTCVRMPGGEWACSKMFCATPEAAYCIATTDDEPLLVGNDKDKHGCIASAGYSWSATQQTCVRIWEQTGLNALELAYDFAYNYTMTSMKSLTQFRANDFISRQEAAKMLVTLAEQGFGKTYASFPDHCNTAYLDEATFDPSLKEFIASACAHSMMKGAKGIFMPHGTLTKGQSLAIIMRTLYGIQDEPDTDRWWTPYVTQAQEKNLLIFVHTNDFNEAITRGDLIKMAHTIFMQYNKQQ